MLVLPSSEYWMLHLYKVYSRGLHNGLLCNAPTLLGVVTFEKKKVSCDCDILETSSTSLNMRSLVK